MRSYWLDSETKESFIPLDTLFLIPKRKRFDVGIRSDLAQKATMLGSYNKVAQECDFGISPTSIRNFVLEIHDELESREIDFVEKDKKIVLRQFMLKLMKTILKSEVVSLSF